MPASAASSRQRPTRRATAGASSIAASGWAASSARASSSSPVTRRESRSASACAASRSRRPPGRDFVLEVLEAQPQRLQRRAQLVRRVRGERLLRAQDLVEPRGHEIEGRRDRPGLRRAGHLRAGAQVAGTDGRGRRGQRLEWATDDAREHDAEHDGDQEHHGRDRAERLPRAARARVGRRRGITDAHRPPDIAARRHGHRDEQQRSMQRPRRPRALRDASIQRLADLRPACEAAFSRSRGRGIGECPAARVDDHDARSRVSRIRARKERTAATSAVPCGGTRSSTSEASANASRSTLLASARRSLRASSMPSGIASASSTITASAI